MLAGAFSSVLPTLLGSLLVLAGALVYTTLIRQISFRRAAVTAEPAESAIPTGKAFGLAELFVAIAVILLFFWMITNALSRPPPRVSTPMIIANELLFVAIVLLVMTYLRLRGFTLDLLAGFSKVTLKRALSTGFILLLAAWPLIAVAEMITQKMFGGSSKQEIVDFFNSSETIAQRVTIIILAVVAAPIFEELIFRFFIYGALRRYFGITVGLILNSFVFAAAHSHLPSALPLFVLAGCFTLAYEWSGSILVSMSMHALFNASQLIFLAFPDIFQQ
jgi:membrane protease YdiL (CAAX protease family)